jgi:DNA-binding FadR family transcriptional regulator
LDSTPGSLSHSSLLTEGVVQQLRANGMAVADEATMSQAIHETYCGPDADHDHPNKKDQQQARTMLDHLIAALAAMYPG